MSEEIKETLDWTLEYLEGIDKTRNTKILTTNEANILLDYITNLQQKVEQQEKEIIGINNIIKELSKDVDMWNKKYNEQFNIIDELEKWLEDNLGNCRTNQNYTSNQIYNLKEDIYYRCLDKLKTLKENNK